MIIVKTYGGLGNQLFQYAFGRNLSIRNQDELLLDINNLIYTKKGDTPRNFLLDKFNMKARIATESDFDKLRVSSTDNVDLFSKFKRKIFRTFESFKPIYKRRFVLEPGYRFYPELLNIKSSCYLSGVWQSPKYFTGINSVLEAEFTLKDSPSAVALNWIKIIKGGCSVSLHIRRGDYITNPKTNVFHGICSIEYYENAMTIIIGKVSKPIFFVFSDDIEWAKKNIKTTHPIHFVSNKEIPDYEELIIMSNCKHNIIANSSFSWWGAWLNKNKQKIVIVPSRWFATEGIIDSDLIPNDWIRI